jgi:GNAT superfamily N-acetyltransferase
MMKYKNVLKDFEDIHELKKLYVQSFPEEERMVWEHLFVLADQEDVDFWAYYQNEDLVGATYTVNHDKMSWLFYFAVVPKYRGQGLGTRILKYLLGNYRDRRLMIDIEDPDQPADNTTQRVRRYGFYKRMGFVDYGIRVSVDTIQYNIMSYGGKISIDDYYTLKKSFRNSILKRT